MKIAGNKTIKELLIGSGRFTAICNILERINAKADSSFPVKIQFDNDHNAISRVSSDDVKTGINLWYKIVETTGENISVKDSDGLFALSAVVDSELEMRLHNYANACAHRHFPDESELEEIRAYEVLNFCIWNMVCQLTDEFTGDLIPFSIPEGWCAA